MSWLTSVEKHVSRARARASVVRTCVCVRARVCVYDVRGTTDAQSSDSWRVPMESTRPSLADEDRREESQRRFTARGFTWSFGPPDSPRP